MVWQGTTKELIDIISGVILQKGIADLHPSGG